MEPRSRKSKCQTCHEFDYFKIEITLGMVRTAASLDCVLCKAPVGICGLVSEQMASLGEGRGDICSNNCHQIFRSKQSCPDELAMAVYGREA